MVWGEGYKKQFGKSCEACFSASKQGGPEHTLRPSFSMAKKSFRHAEAFFRATKSSEKWGSSSCRTPFPGFPHTLFRPVDERFPLFWLAQKPPHLLRRFLSYPEGWGAYTVRERTGCIMRGKVLLLRRGTLLLILTAVFGLAGYAAGLVITFLSLLLNRTVSGESYLYPLIPFDGKQFCRRIFRKRIRFNINLKE